MFFEFLQAVVTLDLNWLVSTVFNNLHWLFAFATVCFFFFGYGVRKLAITVSLLTLLLWAWVDFELLGGWGIFIAEFLILYYISKIALLAFVEEVPSLRKHIVAISALQGILLIVFFNLFLR